MLQRHIKHLSCLRIYNKRLLTVDIHIFIRDFNLFLYHIC